MLIEEEIKKVKEEIHNTWYVNNDWNKTKELTIAARLNYPNDYEIMVNFLLFTTGGVADNDPNVLIQNEKENIKVYNSIKGDKDYDIFVKVIKDAVKEVMHRSKLIGFSNEENRTLEEINNEINR